MSAAIQLIKNPVTYAEKVLTEIEPINLGATEQKLRRALDYIQELQLEMRTLQDELARADRALVHRDVLLRNAVLREHELRAELVKGAF